MEEHKIGDIVYVNGIRYIAKEEIQKGHCTGCAFVDENTECGLGGTNNLFCICKSINCIFVEHKEDDTKEESLDLTKILDGCPYGTKFYSVLHGEVHFVKIANKTVYFTHAGGCTFPVCHNGLYVYNYQGECIIFPSKEQRDWSKFVRFWEKPKKEYFDLKTLQAFDKVLVRDFKEQEWTISLFSHISVEDETDVCYYATINNVCWKRIIPYNDDTKRLIGTKDEAPEYYRYWED